MTFLEILEKTLLQDERFIAEDGKVLKAKVYDAAMAMDEDLLHLLLSEQVLKDHFFKKVNDTLIFDKVEFTWVLNSREFLPDSYTMYKNKIGLVDSSGDLISQKQDVTLVWPYKDCVLEGGQTKDDEKRDEVFYNETLAPDQVTRLVYPKALTNAKRYSYAGDYDLTGKAVGGEGTVTYEETTEFLDDDNLIIKGNNLLALSSLLRRYEGKVKLIYIDPPFNTGGDSFLYNDKFNHSTWLTFMKNRLVLAKNLLANDGVIFIHLDWNEVHYMKVLADEIFGRENFLNEIVWCFRERETSKRFFNRKHNTILFYAKDVSSNYQFNFDEIREEYSEVTKKKFKYTDEQGRSYRLRTKDGNSDPSEESENTYRQYLDEESGPLPRDWFIMPFLNQSASERVGFPTQKPEALIEKILLACSSEKDIILDFFLGSGTTLSTALKMKRQFIGVEQIEEQVSLVLNRLENVISGERFGISENNNWTGGGSFVYCELAERSETLMDQLQSAKDSKLILAILDEATEKGLLRPSLLPDDLKKTKEEFLEFSLNEQRKLVMELLDKNKLYVSLCDMEDENMGLSESSKAFTRSFYNLDKDTEV